MVLVFINNNPKSSFFYFLVKKYAVPIKWIYLSLFLPDVQAEQFVQIILCFFSSACLIRGSCVFAFEHKRWILLAVSRGDDLLL